MKVTRLNGVELIGAIDISSLHIEAGDVLHGYYDLWEGVNKWNVVKSIDTNPNGFDIRTPLNHKDLATVLQVKD